MGIVRNFIDIIGISSEEELSNEIRGRLIKTSEIENKFIGNMIADIMNIYQVVVDIQIKNVRSICFKNRKILVVDCVKMLNIIYYNSDKVVKALELNIPYNTSIELREKENIDYINIYIGDAYFELLNKDTLYSYILYFINVGDSRNVDTCHKEKKRNKDIYINKSNKVFNNNKIFRDNEYDNAQYGVTANNDNITSMGKNTILEEMSLSKDSQYTTNDDMVKAETIDEKSLIDIEAECL